MPKESTDRHRIRLNGFHAHFNGINFACGLGWTLLTFTHKSYDILGEYNVAFANEFECQRDGVYLIVAKAHLTGLVLGGQISLGLDGVGFGIDYGMDTADLPVLPTGNWGLEVVLLRWLNVGDRIRVMVFNGTGIGFNCLGGENDTFFAIQRLE